MKSIVIEGFDATGKSTLALYIRNIIGSKSVIIESEGPARSINEIHARIERYSEASFSKICIFVRHPCVSNPIYDRMRQIQKKPFYPILPEIIARFYQRDFLFVYCRPNESAPARHVVKPDECPDHIAGLENHRDMLMTEYDKWALAHANIVYRIGDDPLLVLKAIV